MSKNSKNIHHKFPELEETDCLSGGGRKKDIKLTVRARQINGQGQYIIADLLLYASAYGYK